MIAWAINSDQHNIDILASDNVILYRHNQIPDSGDMLTVRIGEDVATVEVVSAEWVNDYPKHNMAAEVTGSELPKLRDMLTYRLSK